MIAVTTTVAYLVLIGMSVGTLVVWLGHGTVFSTSLVAKVLAVNPVATALTMMKVPGFEAYVVSLGQFEWWSSFVDWLAGIVPGAGSWRTYFDSAPVNWLVLAVGSVVCGLLLWFRTWQLTRPR